MTKDKTKLYYILQTHKLILQYTFYFSAFYYFVHLIFLLLMCFLFPVSCFLLFFLHLVFFASYPVFCFMLSKINVKNFGRNRKHIQEMQLSIKRLQKEKK